MSRTTPESTRRALPLVLLALAALFTACGGSEEPATPATESPAADNAAPETANGPEPASPQSALAPAAEGDATVIVFLGDSLTAGFGLDTDQAFPALVEKALSERGESVRVVNAGVSGDTTAGGLRRLDWLLQQEPDILVVGLGGNDGLRGVDLADSESNLRQIIEKGKAAGAELLLLGMLIPPNYGKEYTDAFASIYPRLSEELEVALLPFLLEGVAGDPELNQADGIHPTAEGQEILARTVLDAFGALEGLASGAGDPAVE